MASGCWILLLVLQLLVCLELAGNDTKKWPTRLTCHRGTVNSFGVFQTYYQNNPYWTESPSNISWIGSIQAFLLLMIGGTLIVNARQHTTD